MNLFWHVNGEWCELYVNGRAVGCVREHLRHTGWWVGFYGLGSTTRDTEQDAKQYLERWVQREVVKDE